MGNCCRSAAAVEEEEFEHLFRKIRLENLRAIRQRIKENTPLTPDDLEIINAELKKTELIDLILVRYTPTGMP